MSPSAIVFGTEERFKHHSSIGTGRTSQKDPPFPPHHNLRAIVPGRMIGRASSERDKRTRVSVDQHRRARESALIAEGQGQRLRILTYDILHASVMRSPVPLQSAGFGLLRSESQMFLPKSFYESFAVNRSATGFISIDLPHQSFHGCLSHLFTRIDHARCVCVLRLPT